MTEQALIASVTSASGHPCTAHHRRPSRL